MDDYNIKGAASIYAPFVTPDPSNVVGVSRVNVPQQNLNAQKTDGVDVEIDYQVPEESGHPRHARLRCAHWAPGSTNFTFDHAAPTDIEHRVGTRPARRAWP